MRRSNMLYTIGINLSITTVNTARKTCKPGVKSETITIRSATSMWLIVKTASSDSAEKIIVYMIALSTIRYER